MPYQSRGIIQNHCMWCRNEIQQSVNTQNAGRTDCSCGQCQFALQSRRKHFAQPTEEDDFVQLARFLLRALVCTLLCFVHSFWGSNICCQTQWIVAVYPRDFASSLKLALARVETSSPTRRQMHLSNAQNAFMRGRPKDVRTLNLMTVTLTSCRPSHKFWIDDRKV